MATQTVEFRAATGLTITAKLFAAGSDTEVASVTATEATNRKGTYSAAYTDVAAGEYQLIALNSGIPVASWWVTLTLTTATFGTYGKADTRDINTKALDIQSSVAGVQSGVNAIGVSVSTLLSRITSGVATMFGDLIQMITGSGTADAQWTAKALENVPGGSGTGARLVSITVLLGGVEQQSATVRLTKGAESYLATTDEDGLAEFSVDDGTWRVSITLSGTHFTPVDLVVNGNEEVSYSLTANSVISASDPDKITGYWLCLSQAGTPESGVTVTLTAMSLPPNSTGLILDSASRSVTTGADGIASFVNIIPGVRYKVKRNSGREFYFVCPDYQSTPVDLASFIGT